MKFNDKTRQQQYRKLNRQLNRPQASGMSLIELMIAMGLGLILIAASIKIFISSKQSYLMVEELNEIQENGQFAALFLSKAIQMAGYSDPDDGALPHLFLAEGECVSTDRFCTSNGVGNGSDKISVQLNPAFDEDCTGMSVPSDVVLSNVYYVETIGGISGLYCRGYDPGNGVWYSEETLLVNGIDRLQFQFGTLESNRYQFSTADEIDDWTTVNSVRFALLSSAIENETVSEKERNYALLDAETVTYDDSKIRHIYSATVYVNNSFL